MGRLEDAVDLTRRLASGLAKATSEVADVMHPHRAGARATRTGDSADIQWAEDVFTVRKAYGEVAKDLVAKAKDVVVRRKQS